MLRELSNLQETHHIFNKNVEQTESEWNNGKGQYGLNFEMKIEEVEKYINDTTEFVKNGQILQKVIKIDLDDLSSGSAGSDVDCSSSDRSSSREETQEKDDGTVMSFSQMDSEIAKIKVLC